MLGGITGAVILGGLRYWQKQRALLPKPKLVSHTIRPHERVGDITVAAAICGVLGAKIFSILEDPTDFFQDPIGQFFSGSGMTIYGGLILAFIFVPMYIKRLGLKPIHVIDAAAPALIMGYGVGRIGCQLSGDGDWGITNTALKPEWMSFLPDWLWSFTYPHNVLNQGVPIDDCTFNYCMELSQAVYPTPIYETLMSIAIFAILWYLRKRIKIAGMLFFIYLIFNGVERFFIEKIRVNIKYDLGFIQPTQAEIIAVAIAIAGIIGVWFLYKRNKTRPVEGRT